MRSDLLVGKGVGAGATEELNNEGAGATSLSSDGTSQTASSVTMTTAADGEHYYHQSELYLRNIF